MEQLQSFTSKRAGACTSKRTRPQWQPPLCVTMAAGYQSVASVRSAMAPMRMANTMRSAFTGMR